MRENCHKCVHKVICDLWGEAEGVDAFNYCGNNGSECVHFAPDGWIPVTERLPENKNDVLAVVLGDGCQQIMVGWYFAKYDKWCIYPPCTGRDPWIVTHWMPLPKRPEKEMRNHNILTKEK